MKTKKNIILQTTYEVIVLLVPFITAPYISRVFGASLNGVYAYVSSIVNAFMLFAMLGITYHGNRSISMVRDDKTKINEVFSEILFCHFFVAGIVLIFYIFFFSLFQQKYLWLFIIQTLCILAEFININWLFAGLNEFKITVFRNILIKILTVVCIFVFVKNKNDLLIYALIMALSNFISSLAVWFVAPKYVHIVNVKLSQSLKHIRPMAILYIAILASSLMRLIDKTMLGFFDLMAELGNYEYAEKIIKIPLSVIDALGMVMIASSSNQIATGNQDKANTNLYKSIFVLTLFSSLFTFGIFAFGTTFSIFYLGKEYLLTGSLLSILSVSMLGSSLNATFRTQYYIPRNKDKTYILAVFCGCIVNVILNVFLIPYIGSFGAAIATVVAVFLISFFECYGARKDINFKKVIKILPSFLIGIVPFVFQLFINPLFPDSFASFILQILIFIIVFFISAIVYLFFTNQLKAFVNSFCSLFRRRRNDVA